MTYTLKKFEAAFELLDAIHEAGIDMIGAPGLILKNFPATSKVEALEMTAAWMKVFDDAVDVKRRAAQAYAAQTKVSN